MKTKWLRIGSLVFLLGLIAAIPASTQVLFGSGGGNAEGSNLPLLILVNRMELTPAQMEELHGLLEELLEEREARELRRAQFEQEMIAFTGTAEELDEIVETFRAESVEQAEASREHMADVIDEIKGVLTLKQGEVLAEALPGLFGDGVTCFLFGRQDEESDLGFQQRLYGQMAERFAGNPEILERLRQRSGQSTECGPLAGMAAQAGGFRMTAGGHGRMMGWSFSGRLGLGIEQRSGGVDVRVHVQRGGLNDGGRDWIEQLVEVLELKLAAIE